MTSFTTPPVSTVLTRLFRQAGETDAPLHDLLADHDSVGRAQIISSMMSGGDYRRFYGEMREHFLAISPELGSLLYILARATKARHIVEFGLSFGISAIHLAIALRDNGGGRLITTELEPEKARRARENLKLADLADLVDIRVGDALETLKTPFEEKVDLVLLDGAKPLYLPVLQLLEPQLAPGALIVTDNTVIQSPYLDYVRNPQNGYLSLMLPFEDGTEISLRLA